MTRVKKRKLFLTGAQRFGDDAKQAEKTDKSVSETKNPLYVSIGFSTFSIDHREVGLFFLNKR